MKGLSDIQKFYFGKNVFVTGATGFVGKLLVEKLLRSCPGIQKMYLLVREKKGKDIQTRFDELWDEPIFHRMKQAVPDFREKTVLIQGDCSKPGLGLSNDHRQNILEEVNVVFHVAATVKFNEPLREAFNINVRATKDLLELAKNMLDLAVFMHVSTAYCHPYIPLLEEKFYPIESEPSQLQKQIEDKTDKEIQLSLSKILGPWPNTYSFTKAVAEKVISTNYANKPVGVYRPSLVISTASEPVKGWADSTSAAAGIVLSTGMGILHSFHCDRTMKTNLIPADHVANCLITSAFDVHRNYTDNPDTYKPLVYNHVTSKENSLTYGEFFGFCMAELKVHPLSNSL